MIAFVNGHFVPEARAVVSVFDRSFLYGDGLFETMLVCNGRPFRLRQHLARLQHGAEFLGIALPFTTDAIQSAATELLRQNGVRAGSLRLTLSRGVGVRGYSPRQANRPTIVMTVHAGERDSAGTPRLMNLATSSFRLPAGEALARFKTCNKLTQILARAEAEARGADEALLLNTDGCVVEAASSNLFWVAGGTVFTPPLTSGILSGVTRSIVLELCPTLGIPVQEANLTPAKLREQDGVFLSLSTMGIVEAVTLDGAGLGRSPLVADLREHYERLLAQETS